MADEPNMAGGMSPDAIKAARQAVADIAKDFAKIERSAQSTARHLTQAARSMQGMGGGGSGPGGFTTQSVNAGGVSKGQGINTGSIGQNDQSSGGITAKGMFGNVLKFGANMAIGGFNDLRVTANQATNFEFLQRRAATGAGGNLKALAPAMRAAMTDYNVMNKEIFQADVANELGKGRAYGFGGGAAGQIKAAQDIGYAHSIAAMAGQTPEAVNTATRSLASPEAHYALGAMGIQTDKPGGGRYTQAEIAMQLSEKYLQGKSVEEIESAFEEGYVNRVALEQAVGPEAAEQILLAAKIKAKTGQTVTEENITRLGKESGLIDTEESQGIDSGARLGRTDIEKTMEYKNDVTAGVATVNDAISELNTALTNLEGPLRDLAGTAMTLGGGLDAANSGMPNTMGALGGGMSMLGGAMSMLGGGGGGAGGVLRGARGAGRAVMGRGGVGLAARGGVGATGLAASHMVSEAWADPEKDWGVGNTLGNIGMKAASGAMMGSMFGPLGAIGGGILGMGWGIVDSFRQESKDLEQNPGYAEGSWLIEADKTADIHQGEMILPKRIAQSVRDEMQSGRGGSKGGGKNVTINLTVQSASDAEAMQFARRVKTILDDDDEMMTIGAGGLR